MINHFKGIKHIEIGWHKTFIWDLIKEYVTFLIDFSWISFIILKDYIYIADIQ